MKSTNQQDSTGLDAILTIWAQLFKTNDVVS